jgi:hypothetical protein
MLSSDTPPTRNRNSNPCSYLRSPQNFARQGGFLRGQGIEPLLPARAAVTKGDLTMISTLVRKFGSHSVLGAALLVPALLAPVAAHAYQISIGINIGVAPPILPVYAQPICPGDGYLWTPGYWAYGPEGYYWIPGTWVIAPTPGYLWTPAYWGYEEGFYRFHGGYWGPHIGFYGGINYGFGYGGHGYEGGYWDRDRFFYNHAVNNVNVNVVHNTYVRNVTVINNYNHVSYNGGQGGVPERARPEELAAERENHVQPTQSQQQHFQAAAQDRGQLAAVNGGRPTALAARTPQEFTQRVNRLPETQRVAPGAPGARVNEVNARQGNQQQRIDQGVKSGQLTPGETRTLDNRDASIHNQIRTDRQANGGTLTPQERQQVQQRQNNVSNSIYQDKHNANTDAAAAARNHRTPQQEQNQANRVDQRREAPVPQPRPQPQPRPEARPQPAPRQEAPRPEAPREPHGGGRGR